MRFAQTFVVAAALAGVSASVSHASASQSPGVTDESILIGQSAARSGPSKELGEETELGIRLYFDSVNARGGINGRKLQLVTRDDAYQPDRARDNTLSLVTQDRVFALLGYVGTDTSAAAMPVFSYHQVPFVGAVTGAELLRVPHNRYVFNTRASFAAEAEGIVEQLTSTGVRKIAVFYQSDAHGLNGFEAVSDALGKKGQRLVAKGSVERNSSDVSSGVYLIGRAKPDAVILFCAYPQATAFIREMRKQGSAAQFYNTSMVGSSALVSALGKSSHGLIVSQVAPNPWSDLQPVVREYKRLIAAARREPSYGSMEGFVAARVLVEGIRRAGRNLSREGLIAALETMENFDLGGFNVSFSPTNHNGASFVELTIVGANGKFRR